MIRALKLVLVLIFIFVVGYCTQFDAGKIFGFSLGEYSIESLILLILVPFGLSFGSDVQKEKYEDNFEIVTIFFGCFLGLASACSIAQTLWGGNFLLPTMGVCAAFAGAVSAISHFEQARGCARNPIQEFVLLISMQTIIIAGVTPFIDVAPLFVVSLVSFLLFTIVIYTFKFVFRIKDFYLWMKK